MYIYMPRTHTYICVYMFHELNDSIQALFEGLCAAGKAKQAHFEVMLRTSTSWEDRLSILKRYVYTHIVFMCYICVYVNIHACTCMHVFNFSLFLNWLLSANRVRGRSVCGFRKGVCINTWQICVCIGRFCVCIYEWKMLFSKLCFAHWVRGNTVCRLWNGVRMHLWISIGCSTYIYIYAHIHVQPIALGVSFNRNLQFRTHFFFSERGERDLEK